MTETDVERARNTDAWKNLFRAFDKQTRGVGKHPEFELYTLEYIPEINGGSAILSCALSDENSRPTLMEIILIGEERSAGKANALFRWQGDLPMHIRSMNTTDPKSGVDLEKWTLIIHRLAAIYEQPGEHPTRYIT